MNAGADFIQAERILRIDGLLGADEVLCERLEVREAVSELFGIELQLRSKRSDLAPAEVVGLTTDISLETGGGERRVWNALVTRMVAGPKVTRGLRSYRLSLRPQLWLLGQRSDCRIWRDMTSVEICETLLSEHGLPAPVTRGVVPQPEPQHYSVQYNETDLAYLVRRLEEDGIFYWFTHEEGAHRLHLASHVSGYLSGQEVRFSHGSTDRNHINRFETAFSYMPGRRAARDWNFETPGLVPEAATPSLVSLPRNGEYELYEFQTVGGYGSGRASRKIDPDSVERQTRLHMQASEAEHCRVEGSSTVRVLAPGGRFTPYDVANPENRFDEHVVLAIEHEAVDASYETGGNQPEYRNRFLALPADVPATPQRSSPRPRIDGTQIALVAGPAGEEIHPDAYGRIKLWFPWDRRAAKDGSDTCWVRVAQNWAGAGWGGQVIPRIGMEVTVTYLDGDPDRPLVTGVVPNARQKVPYDLPANKTKSVLRSQTHKGDRQYGFNELTFEDARGREEVFLRASRDLTVKIDNHATSRVSRNHVSSVGGNRLTEIERSDNINIGTSYSISVGAGSGGNLIDGTERDDPFGLRPAAYALDRYPHVGGKGSYSVSASGTIRFDTDASFTLDVDQTATERVGQTKITNVGRDYRVSVTGNYKESVGKRRVIDAHEEILIRCGQASLRLYADGSIELNGRRLDIGQAEAVAVKAGKIDLN